MNKWNNEMTEFLTTDTDCSDAQMPAGSVEHVMNVCLEEGIYSRSQLPIEAYHNELRAVSKSGLNAFDEAPAVYESRYILGIGKKQTSSLALGKATHALLDGSFKEDYAIGPEVKTRSAKEWKEFVAANPGKICLKPSEVAEALDMANAILNHNLFQGYLSAGGDFELTFVWRDPATGVLCKARPDFITSDRRTVVDFKTAASVKHFKFQSAAYEYRYEVSAAFTLEGVTAVTGIEPERYVFFVVQSAPPYLVAAYEATIEDLECGNLFLCRTLPAFRQCKDTGIWPGLPEEIRPLGPPAHARRMLEEAQVYSKTETGDWRV
jgi:exodeoxyribonuclease VIII